MPIPGQHSTGLPERPGSLGSALPDMSEHLLLTILPRAQRLALAYAPARSRPGFLALLALDSQLAQSVRGAREQMLTQLRLAWWRDQLGGAAIQSSDPLLQYLRRSGLDLPRLIPMVDGWEELLGSAPLGPAAFTAYAEGKAQAFAALTADGNNAVTTGEIERTVRNWALGDLAARLSDPAEQAAVKALVAVQDWRRPSLPRSFRPLLVLHGLASRAKGDAPLLAGPRALLVAVRLGLLGV